MLTGDKVVLRPVRERDLAAFIDAHTEIANRGEFFPLGVQSEPVLRRTYAAPGLREGDGGTLLIWNRDDVMVGHIEFFRPVNYWDAYELSYQLYAQEHAGQGYTSEAVRLLVDYLFGAKKVNRISLVIVPENAPSRRIAEKCGFQLEGTARGAFFNGGRSVDGLIYSLLRHDPRAWRNSDWFGVAARPRGPKGQLGTPTASIRLDRRPSNVSRPDPSGADQID